MSYMKLLDSNEHGMENYLNTLMMIQANKKSDREAGLKNELEKLMNNKNHDPDAKQNFIDSLLYDAFGIETKNTKSVKINDAIDKIEKELYGNYEPVYDEGNTQRRWLSSSVLGDYDPNRREVLEQNAAIMQDAFDKYGQKSKEKIDNYKQNVKSSFEPFDDKLSEIIRSQSRENMNRHKR